MRRTHLRRLTAAVAGAAALAAALVTATPFGAAPGGAGSSSLPAFVQACPAAHGRIATCFATYRRVPDGAVRSAAAAATSVITPADIQAAYRLPKTGGSTATVGIVDAQNDPKAESDLAVYRKKYKLPACTTANGCFRKVNQKGATSPLPDGDAGWALEISLDLDAVSAACPTCHILLVEGTTPDLDDLGKAVDTAVKLGATVVSNSYGAQEFNGVVAEAGKYYVHPGVPIVASSGDDGFGIPSFPAILTSTIAVGGTTLTKATSTARGWKESAWNGAGSGCSGYVAKPSWQTDTHCPTRMVADVSADADPDSGLGVYDTYGLGDQNGFVQVGGTSLSSPLMAAMIALSGHASGVTTASIYAARSHLYDVVGGSNGYCGKDYLCTGVKGYDGPTGLGSPDGLGAFR